MATELNFIPRGQSDLAIYGAQVSGVLNAPGFDPSALDLTDADVAEVVAATAAHQSALDELNAIKLAHAAATKTLSGPNGTHARLTRALRRMGNKARASDAPSALLASIGTHRKQYRSAPLPPPAEAPEFSVSATHVGFIQVRCRTAGSNSPRGRAPHATGVQIAYVDAATPETSGEAERAPTVLVTRSPWNVSTAQMPAKARLYARWQTQTGKHGPWSLPVPVTVR